MQMENSHRPQAEQLIQAILSLQSAEECGAFLEDLCTVSEIQAIAQRFEVAHLLRLGQTYEAIKRQTGASTATISRVRRCFDFGNNSYELMLDRLYPEEPSLRGRSLDVNNA